jgi:hypothetical protein
MDPTMIRYQGQIRLAELHRQAHRDGLARAARRCRHRAHRHATARHASTRLSRLVAALARLTTP